MIDEIKIMQYADGTLPEDEKEAVEKAIESNPKLKKLFKDCQETADILFDLDKDMMSQPLPDSLKEKLKILNTDQQTTFKVKKPFTFFNIFKVQYAGIAAALALFFYGGFHTQGVLIAKKAGGEPELQALATKSEELKLRSKKKSNGDLSARITNIYRFFDEVQFTNEINEVIADLDKNEEFESSLKDATGKPIKLVLVETYKSNDGSQCSNIAFKEKTLLSRSDTGTNLSLILCKKGKRYELVSINLSK